MVGRSTTSVGDTFYSHRGGIGEVIEYTNKNDCLVKFSDGTVVKTSTKSIRDKSVKNPNFPLTCGLGFYGIAEEGYTPRFPKIAYATWNAMMQRCHNSANKHKRSSYSDCWVNPEWYNFQTYCKWFDNEYRPGWHMDKDIAVKGNREYSKDTVFCVPPEINYFLILRNKDRGPYPIGVTLHRGEFCAQHSVNGKQVVIGKYKNYMSAFYAYKIAKECRAVELAEKYRGQVDDRVVEGLLNYRVEIND